MEKSTESMFLSHNEVVVLTGRRRFRAQVRALNMMGISYRIRPDGRPLVLRSSLESPVRTSRSSGPKLDIVRSW